MPGSLTKIGASFVYGLLAAACMLLISGCGDLSGALPPRPTPVPTLARLPTITPQRPTPSPLPTIPPLALSPTPSPPSAAVELLATAARNANVRSGPSTDFPIIDTVTAGAVIRLRGTNDGWYAVITSNGSEGWMSETVLEIDPQTAAAVPPASP